MQCNVVDVIGRLAAQARDVAAAWNAGREVGMCLLAVGLILLPAFVSARDGGSLGGQVASASMSPGSACSIRRTAP
jgi:hypothetical protein